MAKDFYGTLGVDKNASADEIKSAYRKLAKKYHPDMNKEPGAEQKFKDINEAYEVLGDENKRAQYDQFGDAAFNGGAGAGTGGFGDFGGFGGFSDIFDMFTGGSSRRRDPNAPTRGADVEASVRITFEEAFFGVKKDISIKRRETCETCNGTGAKPGTKKVKCSRCGGTGQINQQIRTPLGMMMNTQTCPTCSGTGTIIETPCEKCAGKGRVVKQKIIKVNIPAGIDDGMIITIPGQGSSGMNGGPAGDVQVYVQVKPDKVFRREGLNLRAEQPISFGKAALGSEVIIDRFGEQIKVNIPAGTQTGTTFRIPKKGFKNVRGENYGDLYITVKVEVPKKLTERQKELISELEGIEMNKKEGSLKEQIKKKFKMPQSNCFT